MPEIVQLQYQEQGDGPPLLILHGLFGSGSNWRRIAATLAERHRVLLVDLRNHGRSPHHPKMDYPDMAADVRALMDRLGLEQASLLGHSMGGKVAMWLALQEPQRVQRLVVADMAPVAYPDDGDHGALIDALLGLDLDSLESRADATRRLAKAIPALGIRQFLLTNLERQSGRWQWRIPLQLLRGQLDTIRGFPEPGGRYPGPALFIHGGRSGYVTDDGLARIKHLFPAAQLATLQDCGHWLHAEDPEGFSARVANFLDEPALAAE